MLSTEVPYRSEIERMTWRREPLPAYAPLSEAGQIYEALWTEIAARIKLGPGEVVKPA
jgi:hypothetical protein